MAGKGPNILVVANDCGERGQITATLREAGFTAFAAADGHGAMAALKRERFAGAVIALADSDGVEFADEARCQQPGLPALLVLDPGAMRLVDDDCATIVKRPFDPRELLGCVFELVLRENDGRGGAPSHSHAAEMSIAAARLACLYNRRAIAAEAGASRLAQDLTRQIGEMRTTYRWSPQLAAITSSAAGPLRASTQGSPADL